MEIFDTMDDEQGSVLEEMGMMPQDSFAGNRGWHDGYEWYAGCHRF